MHLLSALTTLMGRLFGRVALVLLSWSRALNGAGPDAEWAESPNDGPPEHWLRYVQARAPWLVRGRRQAWSSVPPRPALWGPVPVTASDTPTPAGERDMAPAAGRAAAADQRAWGDAAGPGTTRAALSAARPAWTPVRALPAAALRMAARSQPAANAPPPIRTTVQPVASGWKPASGEAAPLVLRDDHDLGEPAGPSRAASVAPQRSGQVAVAPVTVSTVTPAPDAPNRPGSLDAVLRPRAATSDADEPGSRDSAPRSWRDPAPADAARDADPGHWPSAELKQTRPEPARDEDSCWPDLPDNQGDAWEHHLSQSLMRERLHLARLKAEQAGLVFSWSGLRS